MYASKVKPGNVYGLLTVVGLSATRDKWGYRFYDCKCECGGSKTVKGVNLLRGYTKSCGCLQRESAARCARNLGAKRKNGKKSFGESSFNHLYAQYSGGARRRMLPFELSKKEFKRIVSSNCFHCGQPPNQVIHRKNGGSVAFGHFTYNGIDRLDNKFGYTLANSAASCRTCNTAKGAMTLEEFRTWLRRAASHSTSSSARTGGTATSLPTVSSRSVTTVPLN